MGFKAQAAWFFLFQKGHIVKYWRYDLFLITDSFGMVTFASQCAPFVGVRVRFGHASLKMK